MATVSAAAAVLYVDVNSTNPVPPYSSWSTAAANIQDAVSAASRDDEIMVTNGVYATGGYPTNGPVTVRVAILKPVRVRSVNGPQFTAIYGGYPAGIRCVRLSSGASLSGFTLTNGSTPKGLVFDGSGNPISPNTYRGGGAYCASTNSVMRNCVFVGNYAEYEGGGVYGGTLIECTLTNNSADSGGGAAGGGYGAISACKLINCILAGNSASWEGGGACGGTLINCALTNNSAAWDGGGAVECDLERCIISDNNSGARYCTLNNCVLTRNAGLGARFCTLYNCTLTGNWIGTYGGSLYNCLVYNNSWDNYQGDPFFNYCCTTPLPERGTGNITVLSSCVDAGNTAYVTTATDFPGRPRLMGASVDIGAYEFQGPFNDWLRQNGLATDGSDDFTDPDRDGLNNWEEWTAGTVPTNALSSLKLVSCSGTPGGFVLSWQSIEGRTYFIERSAELNGSAFRPLLTDIEGQAGTTTCTDTNVSGPGPYFYRVGVQPDANQFTFLTNGGSITITGYGGPGDVVVIPGAVYGLPVVSIGARAFLDKPGVRDVVVPNTVLSVGADAFESCPNLLSVSLGSGVTNIGDWAFSFCPKLSSITLPESVKTIGNDAFVACSSLVGITIPENVTSIGDGAFQSCARLTSVAIPKSVTSIGEAVFVDCASLTNILVDGLNPFYYSVDGVLFTKDQTRLLAYPSGRSGGQYTIPGNVTNIGNWAFYYCWRLTNIDIPPGVTAIGTGGFYLCLNLQSRVIPNSVVSLSDNAFNSCLSLTNLELPNRITTIPVQAFQGCTRLTTLVMPESVTRIASYAFNGCSGLTSITIPAGVVQIGACAWQDCSNLKAVYFAGPAPGAAGDNVFAGANNATVYYLPGNVGWGPTFAGRPTSQWFLPNPLILNRGPNFGVQTNTFGFIISWATNAPVVVEACTNLGGRVWSPLATNTLSGGCFFFTDAEWTNHSSRLYRVRSR